MADKPAAPVPARLEFIQRFDRIIGGHAPLTDEALGELRGVALIYDIDTQGSAGELWGRVRGVLSRQVDGEAGEDRPGEPLTLMVVEDDAEIAADLTEILTEAGHRVVGPFQEAGAAEAAAGLHALDLALLDINLAGEVTGVALAETLKARWGVPVMFLSGDVTAAARHAHLAEALLVKPFRPREVVAAISRLAPVA